MSNSPRKLNLLIVAAGLGIGGAEVVIQHLARSIDRDRFNLTICCIKALGPIGEAMIAEGIEVVVLGDRSTPKSGILTFAKLLRLIHARQIDVVHTHTIDALFDAALCRLLSRRARLVHTFHFGNYPHRNRSQRFFEHCGSRVADCLVAVGDVQRRQIIETYGIRPDSILRVWNGVAASTGTGAVAFRERLGLTGQVLIGVTATMIEQKGLFDFLTVASRFREQSARVKFVIVGDGELRAQLDERHRELRLSNLVIFAGWIPHANVMALPAFDVFFQPSLWEAMSIALLEAMASAKPVVATDVGEAPCIVDDGVDGFLVKPHDLDAMTNILQRLIDDKSLRSRIGDAARSKVARSFTVERMARSYETIYRKAHHGSPRIR